MGANVAKEALSNIASGEKTVSLDSNNKKEI